MNKLGQSQRWPGLNEVGPFFLAKAAALAKPAGVAMVNNASIMSGVTDEQ